MNLTIRLNIYMDKATGVVYQALKLHMENKTYYFAPLSTCKEIITVVWD